MEIPVTLLRSSRGTSEGSGGAEGGVQGSSGTVQSAVARTVAQPFLVGRDGVTALYYEASERRFKTGWAAPPSGELEFGEFSISVDENVGWLRSGLSEWCCAITVGGNDCSDSLIRAIGEQMLSASTAAKSSNEVRSILPVVFRTPTPSLFSIEKIWKNALGVGTTDVLLMVPGRLEDKELMAFGKSLEG